MTGIDWPGLLRVALYDLRLEPQQFWRLTPMELRIMLGAETTTPPLTRARLNELAAAFPDIRREMENDTDRRSAGASDGA